MLAVQSSRMATGDSGQEPLSAFGYVLDHRPPHDVIQGVPDAPPGAPILSTHEERDLDCFLTAFQQLDSFSPYDMSFEGGDSFQSHDWQQAIPPSLMGTTTSYGPQSGMASVPISHTFHAAPLYDMVSSSHMPPPPPPPPPQPTGPQPSADVLAAATLLQNGSMARPHNSAPDQALGRDIVASLGPPMGHLRHQPMADFRKGSHSYSGDEHDNTFRDMMFGASGPQMTSRATPAVDLQWGSDARFNTPQYLPPSQRETTEALEKEHLKYMQCLEVSGSSTNTGPSSPMFDEESTPLHLKRSSVAMTADEGALDVPPRKRRKSKAKEEAEDYDDDPNSTTVKSTRKRKSKGDGLSSTPPTEGPGRRRRSTVPNGLKQPRENLTEEQKRENHIKSEQKRRTLIKEGFENLCNLVPGLDAGNLSKSAILSTGADWLEELLHGNATLRKQLHELEGH